MGVLLVGCVATALAQFTTEPFFTNPVRPAQTSTYATLASGGITTSPAGSAGFKLAQWTVGMPFPSTPPDFYFGDVIQPPPLVDLTIPPMIGTPNAAFYRAYQQELIAAQAGPCQVVWNMKDGTTRTVLYNIGAIPRKPTSLLFWTDPNISNAPLNTNIYSPPHTTEFAVSFGNRYAKIHYNSTVVDFDLLTGQETSQKRFNRSDNAIAHQNLPAVWVDRNQMLRARNSAGFFIVEFFESPTYSRSVGFEIVLVQEVQIHSFSLVLGQRVLPSGGAEVAKGLSASLTKAGDCVTLWQKDVSHFDGWFYATRANSTPDQPMGDASRTQITWHREGALGVLWPFEASWYAITWPGDQLAQPFIFDSGNPATTPSAIIPQGYTAILAWSEGNNAALQVNGSELKPLKEGRALIQYHNTLDTWFVPVRVIARNNGAYFSNEEVFWPVGLPVQPVETTPRLQFDGVNNYLTFQAELEPEFTIELWFKPTTLTGVQTLLAFKDYPQGSFTQATLAQVGDVVHFYALNVRGSIPYGITTAGKLTAGIWNHVAFRKTSDGEVYLYLNGVPEFTGVYGTFNGVDSHRSSYATISVGKASEVQLTPEAPPSSFAGEIGEIRLWNRAVNPTDITQNMALRLRGTESGLAHLITPRWQETKLAPRNSSDPTFQVLDEATGQFIKGYGTPQTVGIVPFKLDKRLSLKGLNNWAEFPLEWKMGVSRTIEFSFNHHGETTNHTLFAISSGPASNDNFFRLAVVEGHLKLYAAVVGAPQGFSREIRHNSPHHVAVSFDGEKFRIYLDGEIVGNPDGLSLSLGLVGSRILVGGGFWFDENVLSYSGEITDLRVYSTARTLSQINADRFSTPVLTDSTLIRLYNFDQISPAEINGTKIWQVPDLALGYPLTYYGIESFGNSVSTAPTQEVSGGLLRSGKAYHPGIYASESRIIPVNNYPDNSTIEVWWKKAFKAPFLDHPLEIPGAVNRYRLMAPLAPPLLVVAGQNKQGYPIQTTWQEPTVYYENIPAAVGYNPNEEHAMIIGSSLYALRWDLQSPTTSPGFILLQYKDETRGLLSYLQPVKVAPTSDQYPNFNSTYEVGQLLQPPKPLTDLQKQATSGPTSADDPNNHLYQDRRNEWWVRSASSTNQPVSIVRSRWKYLLQPGFYWPTPTGLGAVGISVPFGNTTDGLAINYTLNWPSSVPRLELGQTLSDAQGGLPAITGQKSVEILFDEAQPAAKTTTMLLDPSTSSTNALNNLAGIDTATAVRLGKTFFTQLPPHLRERVFWDPVTKLITLTGAIIRPVTGDNYVLPSWLGIEADPNSDFNELKKLSGNPNWLSAIAGLRGLERTVTTVIAPFDSLVLSPSGLGGGYVTLGIATRTNLNLTGDPVSVVPIFVDTNKLFKGRILVLYSANKFDQYTTLRHSGDFGGHPGGYDFEWRYTSPDQGQAPTSNPDGWIPYKLPTSGLNRLIFGGPGLLTLKDVYFSCRWKCTYAGAPNLNWSDWTAPVLIQSWLTRAMNGINPFEQRMESLTEHHVALTSSLLAQVGKRFVGAVPLNMDIVEDHGLVEIYETLLAQARNLSIDSGFVDDDVNVALLNAASKLNELYTVAGDEAWSDAQDPTIAWGNADLNQMFFGSRASSLFAFQGLVPNLLEEELALLRGLDDSTSTPVTTYPIYNRLYWNFTKGINTGEPAYALNYDIPDLDGDAKGSITEADAARLYPQGHGDAYGHYLTASMNYYKLLANPNFTWLARAEVRTVAGVAVTFNYLDERKMAATALQRAKTGLEIVEKTFKRDFSPSGSQRKKLYEDEDPKRAWSASEWSGRSSQGILYDWVLLNSLLPDPSPRDTPQSVSRDTLPELAQLGGQMKAIQTQQDTIDRGDNPMGHAANAVPFDLDPILLDSGQSHFDQIYARALTAVRTAHAILERASLAALNLRRQDTSLESFRVQVEERESEFTQELIDLYGTPYPSDIGPTGTYTTGYSGPDFYHYLYIDRDLFSQQDSGSVKNLTFTNNFTLTGTGRDKLSSGATVVSYSINGDGVPVVPNHWRGQRAVYGKIQTAQGDYLRAWVALRGTIDHQQNLVEIATADLKQTADHKEFKGEYRAKGEVLGNQQNVALAAEAGAARVADWLTSKTDTLFKIYTTIQNMAPKNFVVGLANGGDVAAPARIPSGFLVGITLQMVERVSYLVRVGQILAHEAAAYYEAEIQKNKQLIIDNQYQTESALRAAIDLSQLNAGEDSVYEAAIAFRQAWQAYVSLVESGNRIQQDLLIFRQTSAARIQEARYADSVFRVFRNEDLADYLIAFDQAASYTLAATRVYDYETGLLDPTVVTGRAGDFMGETIRATQIGNMVDGQPQLTQGTDQSLGSILARMNANWLVLEGRFGINNPTLESHKISLRQELFRIGSSTDAIQEGKNVAAWKNKLYSYRVSDIREVGSFRNLCQLYSPMGVNEPALVIPFSTEITAGKNVFGLPLAGGDTVFDPAHFTTKIRGTTFGLANYNANVGSILTKTPRFYLVPVGIDRQRTALSGGLEIRDWRVVDQVMPMPYASASGNIDLVLGNVGTDNIYTIRRFPPMRAYDDAGLNPLTVPYDSRLVGRSVWNTQWLLIIPGSSLSASPAEALESFIQGVTDINLFVETYSYSGN